MNCYWGPGWFNSHVYHNWLLLAFLLIGITAVSVFFLRRRKQRKKCPECSRPVEEAYLRCPECGQELKKHCPGCCRIVENTWQICPYCESSLHSGKRYEYQNDLQADL